MNDLAFCYPNKKLSVITCGDDKTIKVGYENSSYVVSHREKVIYLRLFFCLYRCGMWLLVQSCILLKVMRLPFILFALTAKKMLM